MPISSKRIIEAIRAFKGPFTHADLLSRIGAGKAGREHKKTRRPAKKSDREQPRIEETLRELTGAGFLVKRGKSYTRAESFSPEGVITVDGRGVGTLKTDSGDVLSVKKDNTGNAHSGDRVRAELDDCRGGTCYARITAVSRRRKERYIARVETRLKDYIVFRLVDLPGGVQVRGARSSNEPRKGELCIIHLTG
ncbi:MAG: hypothetical protein EHM32_13320, partial [Spirochaetales bacterium]